MIFQVIGLNTIYGVFQASTWKPLNLLAAFQDFYTSQESNIPGAIGQDALVSLAGAVGAGLTWSGSIFVNPLMTRVKDVRIITVAGAFIMCFGLFFASFNTKLWHLYLTQALMYGIGSSMYYFPIMSIAPVYFDRHRGFAMGFILAGNGCGGLVLAPATNALISHLGIRWALRILGLVNLALAIPAACVVKQRPGYKVGGGLKVSMGLVKQGTFLWQSLGAFLQAAGNFVPMIYMATYSTSVLGYSASTASLVIALNNGVNSISRVLMGVLADRVGRQNTMFVGVSTRHSFHLCPIISSH
ncbi:MFS general substrate transporter [Coniophora puteana RWD-64-598 SS2]|uniref:MFS general substrate transporter n=1 Tax=Coniophora puteana (strain RWD-64-598) TaxID=741705 RepID=A0A5M3MRC9_CONPW|nr:MFS general substrate transporter [Coniophora puteana RWD-64-598 SS2]EIW81101.1 MFS general substrate transporter [Coniophora puteana RWD-64-598 SS2]